MTDDDMAKDKELMKVESAIAQGTLMPTVQENSSTAASGDRAFGLSVVSQQYDRTQKGYLDSTELHMRTMDTENAGHLDINKVYEIMKELRAEQKNSMTLRKIIYALSGFAVLLALANIGTSFVAATLAKESHVDSTTHDLVDKNTGDRVGTTDKIDVVQLFERPPYFDPEDDNDQRRHLRRLHNIDVDPTLTNATTGTAEISQAGAIDMYGKLCSGFDEAAYDRIKSGTDTVASCDAFATGGVMTKMCSPKLEYTLLKLRMASPATLTGNGTEVTFFYEAYRGPWYFDNIEVACPVDGTADCVIYGEQYGLTCNKQCEMCNATKKEYWFCGAAQWCHCGKVNECYEDQPPFECMVPATCGPGETY